MDPWPILRAYRGCKLNTGWRHFAQCREGVSMKTFAKIASLAFVAVFGSGCGLNERPAASNSPAAQKSDAARQPSPAGDSNSAVEVQYATVGGLKMYYEIHGRPQADKPPLVMIHGAFGWATVFPALVKDRQVIAIELEGHGHTAALDRPLSFEQMADDAAGLLKELRIEKADFFGYSLGGTVSLAVAIRHPDLVRKAVTYGSHAGALDDAYDSSGAQQIRSLSPAFAPPMLKDHYDKVAPDPKRWPELVARIRTLGVEFKGFSREEMQTIKAQVLIAFGDRDV